MSKVSASGGSTSEEGLHPVGLHLGGLHTGGIGQTPSPRALQDTVNKPAVRILLECILILIFLFLDYTHMNLSSKVHHCILDFFDRTNCVYSSNWAKWTHWVHWAIQVLNLSKLILSSFCLLSLSRGGLCRETPLRNQNSGWYASYWNAHYTFKATKFLIGVWIIFFYNFVETFIWL